MFQVGYKYQPNNMYIIRSKSLFSYKTQNWSIEYFHGNFYRLFVGILSKLFNLTGINSVDINAIEKDFGDKTAIKSSYLI